MITLTFGIKLLKVVPELRVKIHLAGLHVLEITMCRYAQEVKILPGNGKG